MAQRKQTALLAPRSSEDDAEQRLREALTRHADGFLATLDSAVKLREANGETSRMRSLARTSLQDSLMRAMEAFALSRD